MFLKILKLSDSGWSVDCICDLIDTLPLASTNTKPGDTWKEEVPPDWVETIVADKEKQQKMETQKPFSEAYIAGMPASKRRKVK